MKKLKHIRLPVLCAAAMFLASCAADSSLTSVSGGYVLIDGEKTVPEYVLELDGEKLGFDRYRYLFLNTADAMTEGIEDEKLAAFWTDENAASLKKQVETYAANEHAILKYAAEKGIKLNDAEQKEVDSFVESVIDTNGMDQFSKSLNTLYLTKPLYRSLQEEERLFQKLYDHLFGEGGELALTEDGYKEYYLANYLRAVQIKVDFEVGENRENCPETLKKAQEIRDEAAAGDFENTARTRNAVLTGKTDPAGFSFSENDVAPEFWQAASLLKEGEISQPVVTDQGVHVIKRLPPDENDMASRRDEILWGRTLADGSFTGGVYPELFEKFYTDLGKQYLEKIVYNPQIEAYLKPGLVF